MTLIDIRILFLGRCKIGPYSFFGLQYTKVQNEPFLDYRRVNLNHEDILFFLRLRSNIKIKGNLINLANTVNKILISADDVLRVVLQEGKKNIKIHQVIIIIFFG